MKKVVAIQASLGEPCDLCGEDSEQLVVYEWMTGPQEGGLDKFYLCRSCLDAEYTAKRLIAPWA